MHEAAWRGSDFGMSRHILLLTDFSAESERAFGPVAELADLLGARVTLLHVVETALPAPMPAPMMAPIVAPAAESALAAREADARRRLADLVERFPRECEVKPALVRGADAATATVAYAAEHGVDLIAMASHGRTGLRRIVMGSVAESVLRRAGRPVLVYPHAQGKAQEASCAADGRGASAN